MTLPESSAEWQNLVKDMGPLQGPFDWALCLGSLRQGESLRFTPLGNLVQAFCEYGDAESRTALSRLAGELLTRARAELNFDIRAELPHGFQSGRPLTFASLVADQAGKGPEFWGRHLASAYDSIPMVPELAEQALSLLEPVTGKRVLLTTLVLDRPDLASTCVHLLKSQGAEWVGLLSLARDGCRG